MGIYEFATGFDDGSNQAARTLQLSNALLTISQEQRQKFPVLGAGLMISRIKEMLRTLNISIAVDVLQQEGIAPGQEILLAEMDELYSFISTLVGDASDWLKRVRVIGIFEPEMHLQPGDKVQGMLGGSIGCQLSWANGAGFATAGHVAPTVGLTINHYGTPIGSVVWANNPTGQTLVPQADLSVVQLNSSTQLNATCNGYSHGRPYDQISLAQTARHSSPSMIVGMFPAMALPSHNSMLGDIYMTASQISFAGDSGAPTVNPSNEIYGHVIGAITGMSTLVQDLNFQIATASAGLSGLRI